MPEIYEEVISWWQAYSRSGCSKMVSVPPCDRHACASERRA